MPGGINIIFRHAEGILTSGPVARPNRRSGEIAVFKQRFRRTRPTVWPTKATGPGKTRTPLMGNRTATKLRRATGLALVRSPAKTGRQAELPFSNGNSAEPGDRFWRPRRPDQGRSLLIGIAYPNNDDQAT